MPTKRIDITTLTRGNDVTLKFRIRTTVDLAGARFMVKRKALDGDAFAVIDKYVSTTLTADGQITDAGGDGLAVVQVVLSKTNTAALLAGLDYQWDLEVFDAAVKSTTPVGGVMRMNERVRTLTG